MRWITAFLVLCWIAPSYAQSSQQEQHPAMSSHHGAQFDIMRRASAMFPLAGQDKERIQYIQQQTALRAGATVTSTTTTATTRPKN
jgi:hypothetical protein